MMKSHVLAGKNVSQRPVTKAANLECSEQAFVENDSAIYFAILASTRMLCNFKNLLFNSNFFT